jgi:hypothetical protein
MRWRTVLTPAFLRIVSRGCTVPAVFLYVLPAFSSIKSDDQSTPLYGKAARAEAAKSTGTTNENRIAIRIKSELFKERFTVTRHEISFRHLSY